MRSFDQIGIVSQITWSPAILRWWMMLKSCFNAYSSPSHRIVQQEATISSFFELSSVRSGTEREDLLSFLHFSGLNLHWFSIYTLSFLFGIFLFLAFFVDFSLDWTKKKNNFFLHIELNSRDLWPVFSHTKNRTELRHLCAKLPSLPHFKQRGFFY